MAQPQSGKFFKGFVMLINVLAVAMIGATIVISLLWLAIGSSSNHITLLNSMQTQSAASSCIETALQEIRNDTNYAGTATISLNDITCSYTVEKLTNENRKITASSTYNHVIRKIEVLVEDINPTIKISSWQDVADF